MHLGSPPPPTFDLSAFCRRLIVQLIEASKGDPSEMKARIMLARECGHISAEDAEDWLVLAGLVSA